MLEQLRPAGIAFGLLPPPARSDARPASPALTDGGPPDRHGPADPRWPSSRCPSSSSATLLIGIFLVRLDVGCRRWSRFRPGATRADHPASLVLPVLTFLGLPAALAGPAHGARRRSSRSRGRTTCDGPAERGAASGGSWALRAAQRAGTVASRFRAGTASTCRRHHHRREPVRLSRHRQDARQAVIVRDPQMVSVVAMLLAASTSSSTSSPTWPWCSRPQLRTQL